MSYFPAHNTSLRYVQYGYNYAFLGSSRYDRERRDDPAKINIPANLMDLRQPSETITTVDVLYTDALPNIKGYYIVQSHNSGSLYVADARHNSAVNTLWGDGHVSAVSVMDRNDPYSTGLTDHRHINDFWERDEEY